MKKFLCAALACAVCASALLGVSGCGCSDEKKNQPGYVVPTTVPDLKDENFGFIVTNQNEVMITTFFGNTKNVVIPETFQNYKITQIGSGVFQDSEIESCEMADSIREIHDYAFSSCHNLKTIKLSKKLEKLGTNVFFNCSQIENFELPASIKSADVYCFAAAAITSVEIPESQTFTSLDQYLFFQCQKLKDVTIPPTVTKIAENTFNDCPNKITFHVVKGSYGESYAKKLAKTNPDKFAVDSK